MNEKKKVPCSNSDFNDFMSQLHNKYEQQMSEHAKLLDYQLHVEIQEWFEGHYISDSES